jgi:hypothetical protein
MKTLALCGVVCLLVSVSFADEPVGLKVGAKAPGFKLKNQDGKETSLTGLFEKGPVALVFFRSADW